MRKKLPPHPNSKEWKLQFKLKIYRGEILEPYEMSTGQLISYTRWGYGYLHWREAHRIADIHCERCIENFEDYVNELNSRAYKRRLKRR